MMQGKLRFSRKVILSVFALLAPFKAFSGASGPTVGNPNVNEAAEDPEPRVAVSSRKMSSASEGPAKFYATVEAKHMTSDYFDDQNRRIRRDPAFHGKLQLGAKMYGDKLDLSVAGGAVKMPASQAVFQKRPEIVVDVYPFKGQTFNLLWYNLLQVPVREEDRDPTEFSDGDLYDKDAKRGIDSSVFTIGLAPVVKTEWRMWGGKYLLRAGADGWTKLYSKPLYVDGTNESGGKGVGLIENGEDPVDKPFEDRAMRYVHQEGLAVGWTPSFLPSLAFDFGAHIESRYIPQYFRDETGGWDYRYYPERRSFWRSRVQLEINQTWSIQDELQVFRNGFFAENRVNDERRYKNVVRVAAKL